METDSLTHYIKQTDFVSSEQKSMFTLDHTLLQQAKSSIWT